MKSPSQLLAIQYLKDIDRMTLSEIDLKAVLYLAVVFCLFFVSP